MPEQSPRVYASAGGATCPSYGPGHNTHWIPAISKYPGTPRKRITIEHIEGKEFEVTIGKQKHRWFFHDPDALNRLLNQDPTNFTVVKDTRFVNFNYEREGGVGWFNMSEKPLEPCRNNQDARGPSKDAM